MQKLITCIGFLILLSGFWGCDNHDHQRILKAYDESLFFKNKSAARIPPEGTRPIGAESSSLQKNGYPEDIKVTKRFLEEGQKLYLIQCSACHGINAEGRGIVTTKGLTPPPSFKEDFFKDVGPKYFHDIMTNGKDRMPSFKRRLTSKEMWSISAYLEALKLSWEIPIAELKPEDKRNFL